MDNNKLATQPLKGSMLAFVLSTIFLLLLALVAKMLMLTDDILPIINQLCKGIAVAIASIVMIRDDRMLPKALLLALLYSVLNCVLYVCLGGQFTFATIGTDFVIAMVIAVVVCLFKARKR